jgi:plastocyanin
MKRVLAIVVALVLLGACGSSGTKARPPQPVLDWRGRTHVDVNADDDLFTPPNIIISPGTTVTWHNVGKTAHNVQKSTDLLDFGAPFGVDAGSFGPGQSYSFTFKKIGTSYFYVCTIHTGMSGHIEVEAGTPTTTTAP